MITNFFNNYGGNYRKYNFLFQKETIKNALLKLDPSITDVSSIVELRLNGSTPGWAIKDPVQIKKILQKYKTQVDVLPYNGNYEISDNKILLKLASLKIDFNPQARAKTIEP